MEDATTITDYSSSNPPKKRRTIGFFPRHSSESVHRRVHQRVQSEVHTTELNGPLDRITSATTTNNNNPIPTIASTENFSLESRSRLGSSLSSFSSASLSGLPAYVVDIPPIPNLPDDQIGAEMNSNSSGINNNSNNADGGSKKTSMPSIRSLLAIRRYISPSSD